MTCLSPLRPATRDRVYQEAPHAQRAPGPNDGRRRASRPRRPRGPALATCCPQLVHRGHLPRRQEQALPRAKQQLPLPRDGCVPLLRRPDRIAGPVDLADAGLLERRVRRRNPGPACPCACDAPAPTLRRARAGSLFPALFGRRILPRNASPFQPWICVRDAGGAAGVAQVA